MAGVRIRLKLEGDKDVIRALKRMDPKWRSSKLVRESLIEMALRVQRAAAKDFILPGGSGPPVEGILTSRTGTLRRSIAVDQGPLPKSINVGTSLVYGGVHEFGSSTHPRRPFLEPAGEQEAPKFPEIMARNWRQQINLS